ncbi:unnamed protein product [Gadus morhua 'NCC']
MIGSGARAACRSARSPCWLPLRHEEEEEEEEEEERRDTTQDQDKVMNGRRHQRATGQRRTEWHNGPRRIMIPPRQRIDAWSGREFFFVMFPGVCVGVCV